MENLPNNSHRSRQPDPKPEKTERMVVNEVSVRKRSMSRRLMEHVFPAKPDEVMDYVIWEVLIPNTKDAVLDAALSFVERIFGGGSRPKKRGGGQPSSGPYSGPYGPGYIDYNGSSSSPGRKPLSRGSRQQHNFDEIVFQTRGEAEAVLATLEERIVKYKAVTVADLYGLVGLNGDFTDDKWGWDDLSEASTIRHRGEHILDLPPTKFLD